MALAASVVLNRAAKTLLDETGAQWPPDELLDYLRAAINWIASQKPNVYTVTGPLTCTAGHIQSLPSDGLTLVKVDSSSAGAVTLVTETDLDAVQPSWRALPAGPAKHYLFDTRDPERFMVYPPSAAGQVITATWSAVPPRLESASDAIPLKDIYENPLHWVTVAMAFLKNSMRGDLGKSQAYFQLAAGVLGISLKMQAMTAPGGANGSA